MPLISILLGLAQLFTPASQPIVTRAPGDTIAIVNVSIVPMSIDAVWPDHSVLIAGGRIVAMGSVDRVAVPASATVIDGRGKYLVPGLADMHVHLSGADELPMYVGNGVLTVRDLNGSPETLEWRVATAAGRIRGPRILASGPMIAGPGIPWRNKVTPATAGEATAAVMAQAAAGYDQIKVYDGLSKEVFEAVIRASKQAGLKSSGHIPADVGLDGVLASGMDGLEHLDKTVFAVVGHNLDTLLIPSIVTRIRASGVWVTPTLASMIQLAKIGSGKFDSLMTRPEAVAAPADLREFWSTVSARLQGSRPVPPGSRYNPWADYQIRLAGALARAGVPLLAGTDLPNAVLVPGYSLHNELDALVEAGLTRFQALEAATRAPARFFGQDSDWGTVAVGQRANLVLVGGNPLDDLRTLAAPEGVVLRGEWINGTELARMRRAPASPGR